MLYNSYIYLLAFLPIVALVYFAIGARSAHRASTVWLVGASLVPFAYTLWRIAGQPVVDPRGAWSAVVLDLSWVGGSVVLVLGKFAGGDTLDLRRKLHPFLLRRLKKHVAKDLPPKIERSSDMGWNTILGHRKTSVVHQHALALI